MRQLHQIISERTSRVLLLLLGIAVLEFAMPAFASAQTTIYWKKDYINDPSGATIAVATPLPTDHDAPNPPTGLGTTSAGTTTMGLSWTASTSSDTVGYVVYRGPIQVAAVNVTSFTDVGLIPETYYAYKVVAFDASHNYSSDSSTVNTLTNSAPNDPTGLAASMYSSTQINLGWTAPSSGAPNHYRVWRKSGSGGWSNRGTTSSTSFSDTSVSSGTAYLYKVSAENSSDVVLGYTNMDLALTMYFTDDPLTSGSTLVKATHITELRTAVDAVREAAALSSASWTDSSLTSGMSIKAVHISELRSKLAEAINALGLPAVSYTDSTLTVNSTVIKKTHINQLRQAMQ
jgi:hypothetical protein